MKRGGPRGGMRGPRGGPPNPDGGPAEGGPPAPGRRGPAQPGRRGGPAARGGPRGGGPRGGGEPEPQKAPMKPAVKMKQLNWTKINARKIDGTIWKEIDDEKITIPKGTFILFVR